MYYKNNKYNKNRKKGGYRYHNNKYYNNYPHQRNSNSSYQNKREHPIRDSIYATLTCLGAICFAALWYGIVSQETIPLVVGIASAAVVFVTVNISFFRSLIKFGRKKRRGWV